MTNRYICDARISERKFKELLKMFCADVAALTASKLAGVNRKTSQRIYECLRKRVVELAIEEARPFTGEVEIDECYFGPHRVRGRRGRGARSSSFSISRNRNGAGIIDLIIYPSSYSKTSA